MMVPNVFKFLASVTRSAIARLRGYEVFASWKEADERLQICRRCEYLHRGMLEQCSLCTCLIEAKTTLALEQCPKKKWLRVWRKRSTIRK